MPPASGDPSTTIGAMNSGADSAKASADPAVRVVLPANEVSAVVRAGMAAALLSSVAARREVGLPEAVPAEGSAEAGSVAGAVLIPTAREVVLEAAGLAAPVSGIGAFPGEATESTV